MLAQRGGQTCDASMVSTCDAPTGTLIGDFNGDGKVDFADFAVFAQEWLVCTDPTRPDSCVQR